MQVEGKVRERVEVTKYVGIGDFTPVAINPNKEELEKLRDTELDEEPEYAMKEMNDGRKFTNIQFWAKESVTGEVFPITFMLIDEDAKSSDGKKDVYINQVGDYQYVDDEKNLFDSFRNFQKIVDWKSPEGNISRNYSKGAKPNDIEILGKKEFRKAKGGEKELYSFLRSWVTELDYSDSGTNLLLDFEDLMSGEVSELEKLIGNSYATSVVAAAIVKTDKNDETKQYQNVSKKAFLPGSVNGKPTLNFVKVGTFPNSLSKLWKEFQEGVNREKAFHSLDLIHVYDAEKDINTSDKAINPAEISY